ncbi:MAG: hypothetical protein RL528_757 [Bacteroidota bacterium]
MMNRNFEQIINFWFVEITPKDWWIKSIDLDHMIIDRFQALHKAAFAGELFSWRKEPLGRLAEIIVLDQFSRNMFRDKPESFICDPMANTLSMGAIEANVDIGMTPDQKGFLYMPMMHSESLLIHEYAQAFFSQEGCESYAKSANRHKEIIQRFGRYPHRNRILGRESSSEEIEFLKQPGSSF